jgi:hypothetical protein
MFCNWILQILKNYKNHVAVGAAVLACVQQIRGLDLRPEAAKHHTSSTMHHMRCNEGIVAISQTRAQEHFHMGGRRFLFLFSNAE